MGNLAGHRDLASQLESCAAEQAAAIQKISNYQRQFAPGTLLTDVSTWGLPQDALEQVRQARECVIVSSARMQAILTTPADFVQRLARENQILAGLQWLCDFQILALIPLDEGEGVPFGDVAFLASVPEAQLRRVARMMATSGFLSEPRNDNVAHTALSASFVSEPGLFDAALFLSSTVAPAALNMSQATRQFPNSDRPEESAYNVAISTSGSSPDLRERRPRFQTQWPAYLHYGTKDEDSSIRDVLTTVDWGALGNATVVDVGAESMEVAVGLAKQLPFLRFVVEPYNSSVAANDSNEIARMAGWPNTASAEECDSGVTSRVSVQQRPQGTMQFITDAAVYILHLPSPSPTHTIDDIVAQVAVELSAHMDVLRANPASSALLLTRVLPTPGSVDPVTESSARLRDLSLLQLANGREVEPEEIMNIVRVLRDQTGGLVLTGELRSPSSSIIAFEVRYQSDQNRHSRHHSNTWSGGFPRMNTAMLS